MLTESLSHFFETLGAEWILWLLLALSVLSLAVIIERTLALRRGRKEIDQVADRLLSTLRDAGAQAAVEGTQGRDDVLSVVARAVLLAAVDNVKELDTVLNAALARERMRFERRLSILSTIAVNAPFIGLLGTVIGVLNAFAQLAGALEGTAKKDLVMSSISEALVATAVGLAVAIPAAVAFNAFKGAVKKMLLETGACTRMLIVTLYPDRKEG